MPHSSKFAVIDLLRALAAQMIVIHHLAFYGPMSDYAYSVAARPIDWLYMYGRWAVQVFFVTGGYCLAGSLARKAPTRPRAFVGIIVERYVRIGLPYLIALVVALGANELARSWADHSSISATPTLGQLMAHVFLVHKLLGYDSLTAGIWYLAIDLQLVALVVAVHAATHMLGARSASRTAKWTILALGVASAFLWNRSPALDRFGIYFMASYVLGMAAAWTKDGSLPRSVFWGYLAIVILSLQVDFRPRLIVSAAVAAVLVLAQGQDWLARIASLSPLKHLSKITYSLFLIHFPICLVINAWWSAQVPHDPRLAMLGMGLAWGLSVAAAFVFFHLVERRLARLRLADIRTLKWPFGRSTVVGHMATGGDN